MLNIITDIKLVNKVMFLCSEEHITEGLMKKSDSLIAFMDSEWNKHQIYLSLSFRTLTNGVSVKLITTEIFIRITLNSKKNYGL